MKRILAGVVVLAACSAQANNLEIANVAVTPRDATTAFVSFDISWENSWRHTVNHDAAWVFFKVQQEGGSTWSHVTLVANQALNPTDYSVGSGTALDFIVPTDKVGVFVRRAAAGAGTLASTSVKAVWDFTANGFSKNSKVKIQAFGVEMVYVAEGAFYLGSGGTEANRFYRYTDGSQNTLPYQVTSTNAILGGTQDGKLWATGQTPPATIPSTYPNGYAAFYCMKYNITERQYADFLAMLDEASATTRKPSAIGGSWPNFTTSYPDRALGNISWDDGCAFTDWACLRPMTELEYEKACRGPLNPIVDEYAWGTTAIKWLTGYGGTQGSGTETASPSDSNIGSGPFRVGIFATDGSTRERSGASYWGVMELSGCVCERPIRVTATSFTGLHGDGVPSGTGFANVSGWPGSSGCGFRGGMWNGSNNTTARVSDRENMGFDLPQRQASGHGQRAVRTAPAGVGP